MIDLTAMPRDCDCVTHDGLHWLYEDRLAFERNLILLERALAGQSRFGLVAFAQEEAARLRNKRYEMQRYTRDETETFHFPPDCSERAYRERIQELLDRSYSHD